MRAGVCLLVVLACVTAVRPLSAQKSRPVPGTAASQPVPALKEIGIDQKLDGKLPLDMEFSDESGAPVKLNQYFKDRPVVLALVYYGCPMLCTQVLNGLASSLKGLALAAVETLAVRTVLIPGLEGLRLGAEIALLAGREGALALEAAFLLPVLLEGPLLVPVLLAQLLLGGGNDSEIMLRVLEVILGQNRIAGGLGVARQLEIFLRHMRRIAAHLHVRTVRFEVPAQRIDVLAPAIVVPAALAVLVALVGSHWSIYAFKMSLWVALILRPAMSPAPKTGGPQGRGLFRELFQLNHFGLITSGRVPHPEYPRWLIQRRR